MTSTTTVAKWYNSNTLLEHSRLEENKLEYLVSLEYILQTIRERQQAVGSDVQLKILDLGGGTGRYAVQLAKHGHIVTLADISSAELERAREYAASQTVYLENIVQVDARDVHQTPEIFKPDYYDIILCQGPLYHLVEYAERRQVLHNCCQMLKPGGFLVAAFVTIYAHLRDVVRKDPGRLVRESDFYREYLRSGKYTRSPEIVGHHTVVDDIRTLFGDTASHLILPETPDTKHSLTLRRVLGCESLLAGGLSAPLRDVDTNVLKAWTELAVEHAEKTAETSDHVLVIARKD